MGDREKSKQAADNVCKYFNCWKKRTLNNTTVPKVDTCYFTVYLLKGSVKFLGQNSYIFCFPNGSC